MNFDYKEIGRKIRYYRKKADLTQAELGFKINRSESSVTKYETGLTDIPLPVMELTKVFISPFSVIAEWLYEVD